MKKRIEISTVFFLGIFLLELASGCAGPEYIPPPPEKPTAPLSLEAAVDLAIRNNPDITAAKERLAAAQAAIDEAYSYYWPVLQLIEKFTQTDTPSRAFGSILDQGQFSPSLDFNDPGVTSNFRTGIAGSITLYDGGRRRARVAAQIADALSLQAALDTARRDIAFEVARAYFLVFKARETAEAQEKSIETLNTHLRITEARLSEGAVRRSDVLAVRVRLAETREAAIVARNSSLRAKAGLRVLLGLGVEDPLQLQPPPKAQVFPPPDLKSLLKQARENRSEILRAKREIEKAAAKVREAYAGYFPEITIFGDFGFDSRDSFFENPSWLWGVSFMESLFDALRTPTRVREAMANLAAVYASGRKTVLQVELDVRHSILDAEDADARYEVATQAADLAEESLRLVEVEYREGTATITRLLESELALTQARTRLSAATYDRTLSRISIEHATGRYPELMKAST